MHCPVNGYGLQLRRGREYVLVGRHLQGFDPGGVDCKIQSLTPCPVSLPDVCYVMQLQQLPVLIKVSRMQQEMAFLRYGSKMPDDVINHDILILVQLSMLP